jgi:hypothetical protein
VDEPKENIYGGVVAAPIWREMVEKTLKYLNVKPDGHGKKGAGKVGAETKLVRHEKNGETDGPKAMPDLRGLTLREALGRLEDMRVHVVVTGTGVVVNQRPLPGRGPSGPVSLSLMPRGAS